MCYQDDPPAICSDPDFSIQEVSADMAAIPNLYDADLVSLKSQNIETCVDVETRQYCSECFMKLWRQRLLSPFLPVSNFTDYLVNQFEDMQQNCSTSMPYTTSASTLYVGSATSTADSTTTGMVSTATCTGQWIQPVATPLSCNELSELYNVSTGDLRAVTNDPFCEIEAETCLPRPCSLAVIDTYGTTW
jgi:hypothetical protein